MVDYGVPHIFVDNYMVFPLASVSYPKQKRFGIGISTINKSN